LNFGDKHVLIEQIQIGEELIMGFAIASASLDYFRISLKFGLDLFKTKFGATYSERPCEVGLVEKFKGNLKKIFDYAYVDHE
jgi:hypothetical protein